MGFNAVAIPLKHWGFLIWSPLFTTVEHCTAVNFHYWIDVYGFSAAAPICKILPYEWNINALWDSCNATLWRPTYSAAAVFGVHKQTHSCPQLLSSRPDVDPEATSSKPLTRKIKTTCLFIKRRDRHDTGLNQYHVARREPPCPLLFNIVGWASHRMGRRDTHVRLYITTCGCIAGQEFHIFQLEIHIMSKW